MPELPEVETVVRDLRPLLVGRAITAVTVGKQKLRRPWVKKWGGYFTGKKVTEIRRRGKYILILLSGGGKGVLGDGVEGVLVVHLGMTGQFTVNAATDPLPTHTHLVFDLSDRKHLRFRDPRRFGQVLWYPDLAAVEVCVTDKLGPEPFDIPAEQFEADVRGSKRTLKAILLDQSVVAGVGNIYADEALFRAGLHPERRGETLSLAECDRLRMAIETVIARAIAGRGSTIRDYIGGSGLRGQFQNEHAVYGRTGEACVTCGRGIERVVVGGRSSHFCPKCQPRGKVK